MDMELRHVALMVHTCYYFIHVLSTGSVTGQGRQPRSRNARISDQIKQCWSHPLSRLLRSWWRLIVIVLTPLVFSPIPIVLKDDVSTFMIMCEAFKTILLKLQKDQALDTCREFLTCLNTCSYY